jgi:hypothetical protein
MTLRNIMLTFVTNTFKSFGFWNNFYFGKSILHLVSSYHFNYNHYVFGNKTVWVCFRSFDKIAPKVKLPSKDASWSSA